jgi:hypothetical protein
MFKPYAMEDVRAYAVKMGYAAEDIEIEYSGDEYQVRFGHEYTEIWEWSFDDLKGLATDYDHIVWED